MNVIIFLIYRAGLLVLHLGLHLYSSWYFAPLPGRLSVNLLVSLISVFAPYQALLRTSLAVTFQVPFADPSPVGVC